jgi:hypothetical protein
MWKMMVAAVLVGHGLIHLLGVTAYLKIAELTDLPYKTTLLAGRLDVGDGGTRVFGMLWILPAVGFVAAAAGLVMATGWWLPLLVATTCLSAALTALDTPKALVGLVVNLIILALLCVLALWRSPTVT